MIRPGFEGRHRIEGFVHLDGTVSFVEGYYCQNGNETNDGHNMEIDGIMMPDPENKYPMYFSPDLGYSMGADRFKSERRAAVTEAWSYIEAQRQRLDTLADAL